MLFGKFSPIAQFFRPLKKSLTTSGELQWCSKAHRHVIVSLKSLLPFFSPVLLLTSWDVGPAC